MAKPPNDLQILKKIYATYRHDFLAVSTSADPLKNHVDYVSIDVSRLAKELSTNRHELFGRLYHHLDKKYQYKKSDDSCVYLFRLKGGEKGHCINFPYLAAILSEHQTEHRRNLVSVGLSMISLIIASSALLLQFFDGTS